MGLIFATGVAVVISVFLAGLFVVWIPLSAAYLFLITVVSTYYGLKYPNYFYFLFAINFSAILASCIAPTLHENIVIIAFMLGVAVIAALFQLVFIRGFTRRKVRSSSIKSLRLLGLVSKEIFSCFLQPEYADNIYLFERRLHIRKKYYMRSMNRLRHISALSEMKTFVDKIDVCLMFSWISHNCADVSAIIPSSRCVCGK